MAVEAGTQHARRELETDKTIYLDTPALVGASRFSTCILGLGYVGLPTALSLTAGGLTVLGIDTSIRRLGAIASGDVDLIPADRGRLDVALETGSLQLSDDPARLGEADAVFICVPTPIDAHQTPDLANLLAACELAVKHARRGQLFILTSTTYVGTTSDLLVEPLRSRGLEPGRDVFVAFSPERIDPGNETHPQHLVPRILGGIDGESVQRARTILAGIASEVHVVSSPEAAEMTKLYENAFRAVNIAFALEMSTAAGALGLSIIEVIEAAKTKPYGFMPFYPGPGVGGHCIPCDPHYLLWQMRARRMDMPVMGRAMETIAARPHVVAQRLRNLLANRGRPIAGARILLVGAAYKAGVRDTRESPAIELTRQLREDGAVVLLWDPTAPRLDLGDGVVLCSVENPAGMQFDAAIVHTVHPGHDHTFLHDLPLVLDATYRLDLPGASIV